MVRGKEKPTEYVVLEANKVCPESISCCQMIRESIIGLSHVNVIVHLIVNILGKWMECSKAVLYVIVDICHYIFVKLIEVSAQRENPNITYEL